MAEEKNYKQFQFNYISDSYIVNVELKEIRITDHSFYGTDIAETFHVWCKELDIDMEFDRDDIAMGYDYDENCYGDDAYDDEGELTISKEEQRELEEAYDEMMLESIYEGVYEEFMNLDEDSDEVVDFLRYGKQAGVSPSEFYSQFDYVEEEMNRAAKPIYEKEEEEEETAEETEGKAELKDAEFDENSEKLIVMEGSCNHYNMYTEETYRYDYKIVQIENKLYLVEDGYRIYPDNYIGSVDDWTDEELEKVIKNGKSIQNAHEESWIERPYKKFAENYVKSKIV